MGEATNGFGIGRAAELEVEKRNAANGALLDHPGGFAVQAFLEEDARHIGGDAEAEVDRPALFQLLRHAAGDGLAGAEFHEAERVESA